MIKIFDVNKRIRHFEEKSADFGDDSMVVEHKRIWNEFLIEIRFI